MTSSLPRRRFLQDVGRGTLVSTIGSTLALDLRLISKTFAIETNKDLHFGNMEPLVCLLQETPIEKLQSILVAKLKSGCSLRDLVAAGAFECENVRWRRLYRIPYVHGPLPIAIDV